MSELAAHSVRLIRNAYPAMLVHLLFSALGIASISYIFFDPPELDSGIFMSVGQHLRGGKKLYAEIWDLKPPGIFLLNQLALGLTSFYATSVRLVELLFAAVTVPVFVTLCRYVTGTKTGPSLSTFGGIAFAIFFYSPSLLEGGNLTEEYGTTFQLAGIVFGLTAYSKTSSVAKAYWILSGSSFVIATFFKEPFVLGAAVWAAYFTFRSMHKRLLSDVLAWWAGVVIALTCFFGYLLQQGIVEDWVHLLRFLFTYSSVIRDTTPNLPPLSSLLWTFHALLIAPAPILFVLCVIGSISIFHKKYQVERQWIPITAYIWALAQLGAVGLSTSRFGHYYLFVTPAYVILVVIGADYIARMQTLRSRNSHLLLNGLLVSLLVIPTFKCRTKAFQRSWQLYKSSLTGELINRVVLPTQTVLNLDPSYTEIHAETRRLSPVRYHFVDDVMFISVPNSYSRDQKLGEVLRTLSAAPPAAVISTIRQDETFFSYPLLKHWLKTNYYPETLITRDQRLVWFPNSMSKRISSTDSQRR